MRKVPMIVFALIIMIIPGCSKSINNVEVKMEDRLPIKAEEKISDLESAAKAQNLEAKDVLINKDFYGGNVGEIEFHGGKVLLWRVAPNRLRVRCSLNMGNGIWRSANVTSDLATNNESPFIANRAMVNDADVNERKVPLWAFYGIVNDINIQRIRVNFIGFPSIETDVENGIWMVIYQGAIDEFNSIEYEAIDSSYQVLYTDEHNLY
ncbi:hypothetical protein CACET_c22980 [Clostridium aceticum]|uniref:Uncharacterized protein n=1 Tax=Clostridium aceticum TaxID=84022 RepID=A0A0D8I8W1_9CLOT|nr:hypothetical protein [Clostridium aceticum]AKL95744.1 hypothetical protein CACET_c22980 [Clostridium aceticum]KJF26708.1 hypothetical protein TZ02_10775 [Clostridium aceticum]